MVSTPCACSAASDSGAEKRATPMTRRRDAGEIGRPLRHARERRPHLAGDAKHDQVASICRIASTTYRRRIAEERLELGDAGDRGWGARQTSERSVLRHVTRHDNLCGHIS